MARRQAIIDKQDLDAVFDGKLGREYPPVLTTAQAAALLQISPSTLYEWKAKGHLNGTHRKVGKHIRFWRDKLLMVFFNEPACHSAGNSSPQRANEN